MRTLAQIVLLAAVLAGGACTSRKPRPLQAQQSGSPELRAEVVTSGRAPSGAEYMEPQLVIDSSGVLHLAYAVRTDKGSGVFHQQLSGSSWSASELLRDGPDKAGLIIRSGGEVCAFWNGFTDDGHTLGLLLRCQVGGVWSTVQNVGSFYSSYPAFAPDGTPQPAPTTGVSGVYFRDRQVSTSPCWTSAGLLAIDRANRYHVAWQSLTNATCAVNGTEYSSSTDSGKTWSKPVLVDSTAAPLALLADKQGRVHLLLEGGDYKQWLPSTGWGETINLSDRYLKHVHFGREVRATLDRDDLIHLVGLDYYGGPSLDYYYAHQNKDGSWTTPLTIAARDSAADLVSIAVDASGHPHFAWVGKDAKLHVASLQ